MEICWLRKLRPRDVGPAGFHFSDVISSSVAFIPGHSHPHSLEPEEKCGSFVGSLGGEERILFPETPHPLQTSHILSLV